MLPIVRVQFFVAAAMILQSCGDSGQSRLNFADETYSAVTYEGRVPLDDKARFLYVELTLIPSLAGEGRYVLNEYEESEEGRAPVSLLRGDYRQTYNSRTPDELNITLINSSHRDGVMRRYLKGRAVFEEKFRRTDLSLRGHGDNRLLILDSDGKPVASEPEYNLYRRHSRVITVEGYFAHRGDTAEFFEMNTGDTLAVSKLGAYHEAIAQYHVLAVKKFERIYLKGTGFFIKNEDSGLRRSEAFVFRKVIQMTSSSPVE